MFDLVTSSARALADVARLGVYAAVGTGCEGVPVGEIYAGGPVLDDRIGHVACVLDCTDRVAASIAFQGLAALLVTPPLAAVTVHGVLPVLTPRTLRWVPSTAGPWRQTCTDPAGIPVPDLPAAAAALAGALLEPHLAPLVATVRARVSVSPRVLWGNAASAMAGARRMVAATWPEHAGRAAAVAAGVLGTGAWAGSGELRPPRPPDRDWTYHRRSCCLFHRTPAGGLCGDCVLRRP